jgi:hypothetical protein
MKILPPGRSAEWTERIGVETVPDHIPNCSGFPGLELEKNTVTGLEVPVLFELSLAKAVKEREPFANVAVFRENV